MSKFFYDTSNNFLCYSIAQDDYALAEKIYAEVFPDGKTLNHRTIYGDKNVKLAGIFGEIAFSMYMGNKAEYVGDKKGLSYDFIVTTPKGNKLKVDVKCKL